MTDFDAILKLTAALTLGTPAVTVKDPAGFFLGTVGRRCVAVHDDRGAFEVAPKGAAPIASEDAVEVARLAVCLYGAEPCHRAARRVLEVES